MLGSWDIVELFFWEEMKKLRLEKGQSGPFVFNKRRKSFRP